MNKNRLPGVVFFRQAYFLVGVLQAAFALYCFFSGVGAPARYGGDGSLVMGFVGLLFLLVPAMLLFFLARGISRMKPWVIRWWLWLLICFVSLVFSQLMFWGLAYSINDGGVRIFLLEVYTLLIITLPIGALIYFTRPKVKEQFKKGALPT